ncbi:hypothetical protein CC86DRAFT_308464 [Ophiobolus disseminans]|uniref:Uncharacterized protein n=1 Tax=Ophiobolus disseminans TaxID=1469910 RepID=A0A6A6ZC93_9PLEO|nr:hypothetical protein CC86DRAFT_308464 [Ophiobolus disseminans]
MASDTVASSPPKHSVMNSSFPVLLPEDKSLFLPENEFQALIRREVAGGTQPLLTELMDAIEDIAATESKGAEPKAPFIAALENSHVHHRTAEDLASENKAFTDKGDVTNVSSQSTLVDLFYDLGENTASDKLKTLLDDAWKADPSLTLKIIFNARSIHLGKSNRVASYKALGWLAENHPLTFLANLRWLVRPVIAKKPPKPATDESKAKDGEKTNKTSDGDKNAKTKEDDEDFDMVGVDEAGPAKAHDIRFGMSHGYWKDLLNLVVFAANDQLKCDGDPTSLLNQRVDNSKEGKRKREWDQAVAKASRHQQKMDQNERVQRKLKEDSFYRALHVTVARLFAEQLKEDKGLLDSGKASNLRKVSLAAKWAPTFGEFHDKYTFILSTIAEILFPDPASNCPDATNRELYLRHIRENYRKQYASPLRKALSVVERDIAAQTFENIKYDRVPSLAMDRYTSLFMKKDFDCFKGYVQGIAKGDSTISGATLLPSTLISKARAMANSPAGFAHKVNDFKAIKAAAETEIYRDVIDGQWNTLVQRVRDAGTLQSSIAICDVSGSMSGPRFEDGSCPMDSAIGLSLLISKVTAAPFGSHFFTFSEKPVMLSVSGPDGGPHGLVDQVAYMMGTPWGMNTNFVAVFDAILDICTANGLPQKDMVKQVFVFSDMQFDSAENHSTDRWTSSFGRIKKKYDDAGYDVPRLIFWNLAANKTDKPATKDDESIALVSGYSQGMLRAFLEGGAFDEEEELVEEDVEQGEDGMTEVRKVKKKIDPLTVVKKTVEHKAYSMLEVVD